MIPVLHVPVVIRYTVTGSVAERSVNVGAEHGAVRRQTGAEHGARFVRYYNVSRIYRSAYMGTLCLSDRASS